jgi:hypothetical protein
MEYLDSRNSLQGASENFDFTIFQVLFYLTLQEVRNDSESFSVFQRFCLLLLIIHGELERVQQERSDEFLK